MKLDTMGTDRRTHYCGTLSKELVGQTVTVCGFVQRQRDLGQLIFIDLRDRTGIVQLAFDEKTDRSVFDKAFTVKSEFVLMAVGKVRIRSSVNHEIPTGEIEIEVETLKILGAAQTPPFEILNDTDTKEELRLKYRFLDLRRPVLQNNIIMRHKIVKLVRDYFDQNGFLEIETPTLIKSTPEGARDYLVPSRIHDGCFFALPQSPQIYKQLLMCSGMDRYMQIARCYRDEDLRADRQPEFTQIDIEMSFVDVDDVLSMVEGLMRRVFSEVMNYDMTTPLPRITYTEAMEKYGSDKPDLRYGMEIQNITELCGDTGFSVFDDTAKNGGNIRAIVAKGGAATLTRKEIDKLTEHAKGIGAKGLAFIRWADEEPTCAFAKFMSKEKFDAIIKELGLEKGDVALIVADKKKAVLSVLGALRIETAKKLDIIPEGDYKLLWIVDFPFFEYNEETGNYDAMHHPFTAVREECIPYLDTNPEKVFAKAYDLVLNGVELSSGSIRITDPDMQKRMFKALGLSDEEAYRKFGFLTDAFKFGAPPHGGLAIGLDRLCMLLCGCDTIRDVIAFPKVANSSELMSGAPMEVDEQQLKDLNIAVIKKPEEDK